MGGCSGSSISSSSTAAMAETLAANGHTVREQQGDRSQENLHLRKTVEQLRMKKHQLEDSVFRLEERVHSLVQQKTQYEALYEHTRVDSFAMGGPVGGAATCSMRAQLNAVIMLKDALHRDNLELKRRLQAAEHDLTWSMALQAADGEAAAGEAAASESVAGQAETREHGACVICMDSVADVVCLPCKHLAICSSCSTQESIDSCPICRADITEKLQIYMP